MVSFDIIRLQKLNNEMNFFEKVLILILILIERKGKSKIFERLKIFTLLNYWK